MRNEPTRAKPKTRRQAEKEQRHRDLVDTAGRLFGTHGFAAVTLDDIGRDVGVSGQAIYRHFSGKQDLLAELLLGVSAALLEGGRRIQHQQPSLNGRIERLISFHTDFALTSPEIIRVQEQEMPQLLEADRREVRRLQREYIEIWNQAIGELHPAISPVELRTRVHGVFGLINSTVRSMKRSPQQPPATGQENRLESSQITATLELMARAAIDSR
ncbi:MAG: TetR/AcrR family transcriptional regulator [Nesterenkonia sp.]